MGGNDSQLSRAAAANIIGRNRVICSPNMSFLFKVLRNVKVRHLSKFKSDSGFVSFLRLTVTFYSTLSCILLQD